MGMSNRDMAEEAELENIQERIDVLENIFLDILRDLESSKKPTAQDLKRIIRANIKSSGITKGVTMLKWKKNKDISLKYTL